MSSSDFQWIFLFCISANSMLPVKDISLICMVLYLAWERAFACFQRASAMAERETLYVLALESYKSARFWSLRWIWFFDLGTWTTFTVSTTPAFLYASPRMSWTTGVSRD